MNIQKINQAVILAGGMGKRLRPITDVTPKPMAVINKSPFLDYLIKSLKDLGIKNVLILTGYKSEKIFKRYNKLKSINISFSKGNINSLSGKRLINAYNKLDDYFLLMYGDNYCPINLARLINFYNKKKSLITLTAYSNRDGKGEYGFQNNVKVNKTGIVKSYDNLKKNQYMNCVNIGYFIVNKIALNKSIKKNISFEDNIMNKYIKKNKVSAFLTNKEYKYITNFKSLMECEKYFKKNKIKPLERKFFK
ncbi:MAG: Glucose-1-phosphate cytidylyltransferase [Alphaproteobacteria bacterium MarineAlpha5_Bin8]|nr:MAG: Glucose-1-phosphate cytidylyltransferase [Alphaproteobacteria bacterium MarineAlpha5_Bin8]PPR53886.1 MAG: Glucose-1-phosphate cytidylyltransferase [Alphaproteobacteria bacterium MarineAlpha5_Bin6]|tara:strand:- start:5 stop:754 length:750 start_codon:yes stop_codon:yes gene_type:complete